MTNQENSKLGNWPRINYGEAPDIVLPCPFCGSTTLEFQADGGGPTPGMMHCSTCDACGPWVEGENSHERSIMAWNIRGIPAACLSWKGRGQTSDDKNRQAPGDIEELSPCPFCEQTKDLKIAKGDTNLFYVGCNYCSGMGPWLPEEQAIRAWNKRWKPAQASDDPPK